MSTISMTVTAAVAVTIAAPSRSRTCSSASARPPAPWSALVLAYLALYWRRACRAVPRIRAGAGLVRPIQRLQGGVVNDYVTWVVIGIACLGGALAFSIR
jgi:hypothetical protein